MDKQSKLTKVIDGVLENDALFSDYALGDLNNNKSAHHFKSSIGENQDKTKESTTSSRSAKVLWNKLKKSKLGKCNIIMVVVNVLISLTLLSVFLFVQEPFNIFRKDIKNVLFLTPGPAFGSESGDMELNDAKSAGLTFGETIVSVTGDHTLDLDGKPLLLSFQFKYSNGRHGTKYGGEDGRFQSMGSETFTLKTNEHIRLVTMITHYRKIYNAGVKNHSQELVVGIKFTTSFDRVKQFGSTDGSEISQAFENHILGYPQGKAAAFVERVILTWYRYYSKSDRVE